MDAKILTRLRPVDDSASALSTALDAIAAIEAETTAKVAELREKRTHTLLTGTARQVAEIEAETREAEITGEQLALMAEELRPALERAETAEQLARYVVEGAVVLDTKERALAWIRDEYPKLAAAIVEGLDLCRAAENDSSALLARFREACRRNPQLDVAGLREVELAGLPRVPVAGVGHVPPSQAIQLPAGPQGLPAFWWPTTLYGRPWPPGF